MDYALYTLGVIMLGLGFWQWKAARRSNVVDAEEIKLLQGELEKAKKDVGLLLDELKSVSEQVVNELTEKIGEVQEMKAHPLSVSAVPGDNDGTDSPPAPVNTAVVIDPVVAETAERIAKSAAKSAFRPQAKKEPKVIDLNLHKQSQEAVGHRNMSARFETVYTLSDLGYSISEIAKQLQMGKGEVELILSIRHREENVRA